jgi:hypothetical protein
MLRLWPGTPAHDHYDELQRTLCVALNACCHYDAARLVTECDPLLWRHVLLPALVEDVTAEMVAVATMETTDASLAN